MTIAPAAPWSDTEARELRVTSRRILRDHGHPGDWDDLTRGACGACALDGWQPVQEADTNGGHLTPNHCAWARTYVQAGWPIPARFAQAFLWEAANDDNDRYRDALARDIATFGVVIGRAGWVGKGPEVQA
jgi:hypothetical protein